MRACDKGPACAIAEFFPEETEGGHGLEFKFQTMGRKIPRLSGLIAVLSVITQLVSVGVGPT